MHIYTTIMIVCVPTCLTMFISIKILLYVRLVSNRIHHQNVTSTTTENITHILPIMSKRDRHLLSQMILIGGIFVLGWGPVYIATIFDGFSFISILIFPCLVIIAALSALLYTLTLLLYDHDMREFLHVKLNCFR